MLLNTNTTLWPPKPKESLSAAISPAGSARGLSRTTSTVTAGSKSSILIVGGAKRSCSVLTMKTDSIAPAQPNKCPVIDLVAETAT